MTLYRKYRPQRFQDLVGQENATTTLRQALKLERVAHSYLFAGPRGTGKTSAARIFARAVNCLNLNTEGEPCNQCANCLACLENRATDLVEIDAASNRGIDDIRALREQVAYPPLQLKRKVYIIDEVHMLTTEAFNALLKTLEEPPPHCLFILATTELHKLPVTIRSRCQLLRFEAGSIDAITAKLERVSQAEQLDIEDGVHALLARQAQGGFRDAETLLEKLSTQHQPLTVQLTIEALGILPEDAIENLLQAILSNQAETALQLVQQIKIPAEALLTQLITRLREQVLGKPDYWPQTQGYALQQLLEAYILQKSSPLPTLPLEIAILNIAGSSQPQAAQALSQVSKPKPLSSIPALAPKPAITSTSTVAVVEIRQDVIKDIRQAWKRAAEEILRENLALGQTMRQAVFHSAEAEVITIQLRYQFHADRLGERKNKTRIEQLLQELTGQAWSVDCQVSANVPRRPTSRNVASGLEDAVAVFGPE